ncbi:MAG: alkaline phosphatase family protein [Pyrinomonadaceae bacterium]|nr:alkaline phosphatase family protein [Pyrinomonadaceae bacterium]
MKILGGAGDERGKSPRRLLASTLGDELRLRSNGRAKVIGISAKDRGAIMPAGRNASAAYWFSATTGRLISSTYYFNQLPAWVQQFNETNPSDKFFNAQWERLLKDTGEYERRAGPDAPEWENLLGERERQRERERGLDTAFPHLIKGKESKPGADFYDVLTASPFSNDLLVEFAKLAITNEALGADADTDVLTVGFSANDYVGHRFGPYSQEVMDITLRTDRQIGELLDFVDARVGLRNTIVAFSADHGVAPVPEHAASLNLPGARINPDQIVTAVKNAVRARFSRAGDEKDTTVDYVQAFTPKNGNVYFNWPALRRDGIDREEIERVAGEAALTVPGVARYFTRTQLERGAVSPADPIARRVLHGFNAQRSGDVVIINQPFHLIVNYTADHSSPYSYDTHVPLIILGEGAAAGRYQNAATPADLAPTLAALLRVESPSSTTGRVLLEGMKTAK